MTTKYWQIWSSVSGTILGVYPGATPAEALDACARDAGYLGYVEACEVTGDETGLRATETTREAWLKQEEV